MERHLASIQQIEEISDIPNADNIQVARISGWHVVIRKGEYNIGDYVIYCEVDSILPARPEFDFLKDKKYRIRTCKLRGQVSQGICFSLDILVGCEWPGSLPDVPFPMIEELPVGTDVTEILGITKYEPPVPVQLRGRMRGRMDRLAVPKTDEMRIQAVPGVLERNKFKQFYITEKIDGTSMSCYLDPETGLHVCSRNVDLAPDFEHKWNGDSYWRYVTEHNVEEVLKQLGSTIAIQGELFGEGIQGGKYKLKDLHYRVFNMWDMRNHCYLERDTVLDAVQTFGLGKDFLVPDLGEIELNHTVDDLVALADGKSVLSDVLREGIVFRSLPESTDPELGRLSFKAVSTKFLLRHNNE